MDLFKDFMSETIDLDDLDVYPQKWKDMNIRELFLECMSDVGRSFFYMDSLHKDISYGEQRKSVVILYKELFHLWHHVRKIDLDSNKFKITNEEEYRLCLLKWRFRLGDETENLC